MLREKTREQILEQFLEQIKGLIKKLGKGETLGEETARVCRNAVGKLPCPWTHLLRRYLRWTAKSSSCWESSGLRRAMFRASFSLQPSISLRNAASTSTVPRLRLVDSA